MEFGLSPVTSLLTLLILTHGLMTVSALPFHYSSQGAEEKSRHLADMPPDGPEDEDMPYATGALAAPSSQERQLEDLLELLSVLEAEKNSREVMPSKNKRQYKKSQTALPSRWKRFDYGIVGLDIISNIVSSMSKHQDPERGHIDQLMQQMRVNG